MLLSKSTEYALRALVFIWLQNQEGKRPGVQEIASEIDAPLPYAAKVLQSLTRKNLLNSAKGRGGGFFFDEIHQSLTLYDVIISFEGTEGFHGCGFGLPFCNSSNPCPLHDEFTRIREQYDNMAKNITIPDLSKKIINGTAKLK